MEKVEQILTTKANNESVNKIDTNVKTLEMKVNGLVGDDSLHLSSIILSDLTASRAGF
jgi:outer membrane murein-binding lipoprotein Lpp